MFTVLWLPHAIERIEQIIALVADPVEVVNAVRELDRMLRERPDQHSESRDGSRRVAFAPPLGAMFEIRIDRATVEIADVWWIRRT